MMPISLDAGGDDRLDAVDQHRLVGHRDELLGGGVGQRAQPRALAAGQDETLHLLRCACVHFSRQ